MNNRIINNKWVSPIVGWALLLIAATALSAEKVTFFHNDALGSPVAATDQAGNVIWRESYRPFGSQVRQFPVDNDLWYTGKPHNAALGLSYFGARWYDPDIGRFTGVDPVDGVEESPEHLFNRYAYANNNPYRYVDPDGRHPKLIVDFLLNVTYNYVTTGTPNIVGAGIETLEGAFNPFKTFQKAGKIFGIVTKKPAGEKLLLGRQESVARRVSEGRGVASTVESTDASIIFKRNYSDIRKAKRIEFDVTGVPKNQNQIGTKFEGGYSRAEESMIRSRPDLLKKTDFIGER